MHRGSPVSCFAPIAGAAAIALFTALCAVACSNSSPSTDGLGKSGASGAAAGQGGQQNSSAGAASAGAFGSSAAGSPAGGAGGQAGTPVNDAGGDTASGAGGTPSAGGAASYPPFTGGGPCPANALLCDNFEEYTFVAMNPPLLDELVPNWAQYKFHGYPRVDPSKPYSGKQSATMDTEAGSYRFAGLIHDTADGVAAVPLAHFGRVMVYLKALPKTSQWTIIELSGLLAGSKTELATYGIGGVGTRAGLSYSVRPRQVSGDGGIELRAGGPQNAMENALATANCTKTSDAADFPVAKWVCVEWNIDAAKKEMHLWLDQPQAAVDALGSGTACIAPAPATTAWQGPEMFTKVALDWEAYDSDSPQQQVWFDELAIGEKRIGCPAPPASP
jgi:hypothetical protein